MQDIMDGYFPSELQDRYPDGVPIKVQLGTVIPLTEKIVKVSMI